MRPEIKLLAKDMERKISANAHKGTWKGYSLPYMYWLLVIEVWELGWSLLKGDHQNSELECADVANFSLFIHDSLLTKRAVAQETNDGRSISVPTEELRSSVAMGDRWNDRRDDGEAEASRSQEH